MKKSNQEDIDILFNKIPLYSSLTQLTTKSGVQRYSVIKKM